MFYFVSRISNSINWRLKILKEKTLRAFPPKSVELNINGAQFSLINPGNYYLTDHLMLNPGVWEKNELLLFSILARYADVIFDVGANIGVYSVLAAKANNASQVYAFEPYSTNYQKILKNIENNSCSNIVPLMLALGDEKKMLSFNVPKNTELSTSVASVNAVFTEAWNEFQGETQEIQVEQTTVDNFVRTKNIQRVDLIKMDVEYYEMNVLRGGIETIKNFKPAILCEISIYDVLITHFPQLKGQIDSTLCEQIQNFCESIGYYIYALGESGIMRTETIFSHPDNRNFIFSFYKTNDRFVSYSNAEQLKQLLPS